MDLRLMYGRFVAYVRIYSFVYMYLFVRIRTVFSRVFDVKYSF